MTLTAPLVEPDGTATTICVSLQLTAVFVLPLLKKTEPLPLAAWKPDPAMVILVPTVPVAGEMLVIRGVGTVKLMMVLLLMPPTRTLAAPLGALAGNGAPTRASPPATPVPAK